MRQRAIPVAGGGVLAGVAHPFGAVRTIGIGAAPELSGDCVVFSNELFDAQPFARTVFRAGEWRQMGVALDGDRLVEIELPFDGGDVPAAEGYRFDRPLAAAEIAAGIAAQPGSDMPSDSATLFIDSAVPIVLQ